MKTATYEKLLAIQKQHQAGFIVLIDPDGLSMKEAPAFLETCERVGVNAFFLGGSLMHVAGLDRYVAHLKKHTRLPIIGFPGSLNQISGYLDALLYISLISSRNPELLFGQHVYAAPILKSLGVEPIPTGYMLVESGRLTTAQYMSHSVPLPRNKPNVAAATALAAEMMGMKFLYTDAGSGAEQTVPEAMIRAITQTCAIPLIVGGGITTPKEVRQKVEAGASFIVVGNALEYRRDAYYLQELVDAAHGAISLAI